MMIHRVIALSCYLLGSSSSALQFSKTLSDNAVLQHPSVIWGTGSPGDTVTTTVYSENDKEGDIIGKAFDATVGDDGIWRAILDEEKIGMRNVGTSIVSSSSGEEDDVMLNNVLFGKVRRASKRAYKASLGSTVLQ